MALIKYQNPLVKLNPSLHGELLLDETFALKVDKLVDIGVKYGITLFINECGRKVDEHLIGTVFTPAKMSNHYIFSALDSNVIVNGFFYSSKMMAIPDGNFLSLIKEWRLIGRWGGDFHPDRLGRTDPVHFDTGINVHDPEKWKELYAEYHS